MPKRINHVDVPLLIRAALLGYWWQTTGSGRTAVSGAVGSKCGKGQPPSWIKLSSVFAIPPSTIDHIIERAVTRALQEIADKQKVQLDSGTVKEEDLTLNNVLVQLHDVIEHRERHQAMPPGSWESELLGEAALRDREH